MRAVRFVLILMLVGALLLYINRLRSGLLDRLAVLALGLVGIVIVAAPDRTTKIANVVDVVRGADLFFYPAIVGIPFAEIVLYCKSRDPESSTTALVRTIALERAQAAEE